MAIVAWIAYCGIIGSNLGKKEIQDENDSESQSIHN